jgi:enoyl-CoA hydratase
MGVVQEIAPSRQAALDKAIEIALKIAACGPLSIKTSLASAREAVDESQTLALSKLDGLYRDLFKTHDFKEGRDAEAAGRPPVYEGR